MRYWAAGLLLTVLLFGGGWLSSGAAPDVSRSVPGADPGQTGENAGQPAADADTLLRVWDGEQVVEMTMAEYLPGVVRGEMPAAFHQQALDAQAVAHHADDCSAHRRYLRGYESAALLLRCVLYGHHCGQLTGRQHGDPE